MRPIRRTIAKTQTRELAPHILMWLAFLFVLMLFSAMAFAEGNRCAQVQEYEQISEGAQGAAQACQNLHNQATHATASTIAADQEASAITMATGQTVSAGANVADGAFQSTNDIAGTAGMTNAAVMRNIQQEMNTLDATLEQAKTKRQALQNSRLVQELRNDADSRHIQQQALTSMSQEISRGEAYRARLTTLMNQHRSTGNAVGNISRNLGNFNQATNTLVPDQAIDTMKSFMSENPLLGSSNPPTQPTAFAAEQSYSTPDINNMKVPNYEQPQTAIANFSKSDATIPVNTIDNSPAPVIPGNSDNAGNPPPNSVNTTAVYEPSPPVASAAKPEDTATPAQNASAPIASAPVAQNTPAVNPATDAGGAGTIDSKGIPNAPKPGDALQREITAEASGGLRNNNSAPSLDTSATPTTTINKDAVTQLTEKLATQVANTAQAALENFSGASRAPGSTIANNGESGTLSPEHELAKTSGENSATAPEGQIPVAGTEANIAPASEQKAVSPDEEIREMAELKQAPVNPNQAQLLGMGVPSSTSVAQVSEAIARAGETAPATTAGDAIAFRVTDKSADDLMRDLASTIVEEEAETGLVKNPPPPKPAPRAQNESAPSNTSTALALTH